MPNVNDPHHEVLLQDVIEFAESVGFTEHWDFAPNAQIEGPAKRSDNLAMQLVRTRADQCEGGCGL